MKKIKLDYEEKQILQDYDSGLFESVPNLKEQIKNCKNKKHEKYFDNSNSINANNRFTVYKL